MAVSNIIELVAMEWKRKGSSQFTYIFKLQICKYQTTNVPSCKFSILLLLEDCVGLLYEQANAFFQLLFHKQLAYDSSISLVFRFY